MDERIIKERLKEVLKTLDNALQNGPWEASVFLKSIGKKLQTIRDDFALKINSNDGTNTSASKNFIPELSIQPGQREIFVILYSSKGTDISSWEHILLNLPRQIITRPLYAKKEDALTMIKSKANPLNEAFVSVFIDENKILKLSEDKIPQDKFGIPLITLRESIKLEDINIFYYRNNTYRFYESRLIKL